MKKVIDITGERFGKLKVIKFLGINDRHRAIWECKCDCGNIRIYDIQDLKKNKSCGCERYKTDNYINASKKNQKKAAETYIEKYIIEDTNICIIKNDKLLSNNRSGVKGVSWDNCRKKWVAQIQFKKKNYNLGRYDKKEDAINARKDAEEKFHKQFLREKGLLNNKEEDQRV